MNIYVGNLSPDTSLSDLRSCFEKFGTVERVTISPYKVHGVAKGFGQVLMPADEHAQAAIAGMDGKPLDGHTLKVQTE
jgi:RNA recognition motif-containing protein